MVTLAIWTVTMQAGDANTMSVTRDCPKRGMGMVTGKVHTEYHIYSYLVKQNMQTMPTRKPLKKIPTIFRKVVATIMI